MLLRAGSYCSPSRSSAGAPSPTASGGSPQWSPRLSEQLFDLLGAILTRCKYGIELQVALGDKDVDYVPSCPAQFDTIPSIPVLQAGILNIACMLHSGRKALVERALVERHYLVEACHSLQLLVQSKRPYNFKTTTNSDHDDLLVEWQMRESKIRSGMMIWVTRSYLSRMIRG